MTDPQIISMRLIRKIVWKCICEKEYREVRDYHTRYAVRCEQCDTYYDIEYNVIADCFNITERKQV